jgi:hypothetical protein
VRFLNPRPALVFTIAALLLLASEPIAASTASLELILDCSRSMKELAPKEDVSRARLLRSAVAEFLHVLPPDLPVAIRLMGSRSNHSCEDSVLAADFLPAGDERLLDSLAQLQPLGQSTLVTSIRQAAADLKKREGRTYLLVLADGPDSCEEPLKPAARDLQRVPGITFQVAYIFNPSRVDERLLEHQIKNLGGKFSICRTLDKLNQLFDTVVYEISTDPAPEEAAGKAHQPASADTSPPTDKGSPESRRISLHPENYCMVLHVDGEEVRGERYAFTIFDHTHNAVVTTGYSGDCLYLDPGTYRVVVRDTEQGLVNDVPPFEVKDTSVGRFVQRLQLRTKSALRIEIEKEDVNISTQCSCRVLRMEPHAVVYEGPPGRTIEVEPGEYGIHVVHQATGEEFWDTVQVPFGKQMIKLVKLEPPCLLVVILERDGVKVSDGYQVDIYATEDGRKIAEGSPGQPFSLNPGTYTVRAFHPDQNGRDIQEQVSLKKNDRGYLSLELNQGSTLAVAVRGGNLRMAAAYSFKVFRGSQGELVSTGKVGGRLGLAPGPYRVEVIDPSGRTIRTHNVTIKPQTDHTLTVDL